MNNKTKITQFTKVKLLVIFLTVIFLFSPLYNPNVSAATIIHTFTSDTTWTVPAGVTSIEIDAYGGRGENGESNKYTGYGGRGARIKSTHEVTSGDVLYIRFIAGGRGGSYGYDGGAGGSAVEVRKNVDDRTGLLIVAGGGGGGGGASSSFGGSGKYPGDGGSGGYPNGYNGCNGAYGTAEGGSGATQTSGIASGNGGNGSRPIKSDGGSGGGGGAGYFGGYGGDGNSNAPNGGTGGGGGGGSSFTSGTLLLSENGTSVEPKIIIEYEEDATPPMITITQDISNWTSSNVTLTVSAEDKQTGMKQIQRPDGTWVLGSTTTYSVSTNGVYTFKAQDNAGNEATKSISITNIDKAPPVVNIPSLNIEKNQITVTPSANDNQSGLSPTPYIYNRNGENITNWTDTDNYIDTGLTSNTLYTYRYKARDNLNNEQWSPEISKYTLALNPIKVQVTDFDVGSLHLKVVNDAENGERPEIKLTLKIHGTDTIRLISDWNTETERIITGLQENESYDAYLQTRNGDKVENAEILLSGTSSPSLESESGVAIDYIPTLYAVKNFNVSASTDDSLTVSWENVENQEYQLYLMTEAKEKITESPWMSDTTFTFSNANLIGNTKYIPYIITRSTDAAFNKFNSTPQKVINEARSFTNAQVANRGNYTPGDDFITVSLDLSNVKNSSDTEYEIKNNTTGQYTTVSHLNPIWLNTGLSKESYYQYTVRPLNKNGEPSYFANLQFPDGDAHTTIIKLDLDDAIIGVPETGIIDLDALDLNNNTSVPVPFDLNNIQGKTVKHNGKLYYLTRNKMEVLQNSIENPINAKSYAVSKEGYGYSNWKNLNENGTFSEQIYFNQTGIYNSAIKFKNYTIETEPVIKGYLADWTPPVIIARSKQPGQNAVTGSTFTIIVSATDNVSPYLFYTTDNVNWNILKEGNNEINFTNIQKSSSGIMNNLTITISDLCGNKTETIFIVWGIQK